MRAPSFLRLASGILALVTALAAFAAEQPDYLTRNIDTSVAPGGNLFGHAVGGWLKRHPIPPSENGWGVGYLVREQLYGLTQRPKEYEAEGGYLETRPDASQAASL